MAFKLTPGIKGNPAQNRIQGLGLCGGEGQQPCEPLFEKEKQERKVQTFKRAKIKEVVAPVVVAPVKEAPVKEAPVKEAPVFAGPIIAPIKGGGDSEAKPVKGKK
jgi:hypothetical protein